MNRFFLPKPDIAGSTLIINDKDKLHHIRRVLCLKPKERLVVFDGQGCEYDCIILSIGENVTLEIKDRRKQKNFSSGAKLTIACAIPKKAKFDEIVDKLTQLGASRIIPLITERVVVRLDRGKEEARLLRWKKIAQSASEQSKRSDIPVVEPVCKFKELLARSKDFDLKLIPSLSGERRHIGEVLDKAAGKGSVLAVIGPEVDFSDGELRSAENCGFVPVSLGSLVLRVDTAAVAVASLFQLTRDVS